ncbi:hypothetical protein NIES21_52180 [Anabaenopsis circularis NIES-21]|uniref:Uncharacterized protein n=1 Tax=Anabaenopsis circularis NIES-21 TaxID=1085406 RepID=A0A1Z4GPF4_9CYAN|nr:hypothetical protein NIES21_52180 [Anabaenopsis circularis NIES-21]
MSLSVVVLSAAEVVEVCSVDLRRPVLAIATAIQ